MSTIAVVGASGRVGSAIAADLAPRFQVRSIRRQAGEPLENLVERAVFGAHAVINAAGVAHLDNHTEGDLKRLQTGNVDLPLALASRALRERISMVHISSVKAAAGARGPYALSKRQADLGLSELDGQFRRAEVGIATVRPLALLLPPFDAGKLAKLSWIRHVPPVVVPPIRLPVLTRERFVSVVSECLRGLLDGEMCGYSETTFSSSDRGTLRDLRAVLSTEGEVEEAP
jgi:uncharacterized protein YbjT (DUF2867 family)